MLATAEQREARRQRRHQDQQQWLISKLRWMGLEQEADKMTAASATPTATTLPAETD